ncbi:hypothetical protein HMPREF2993_10875 [Corynebacterium sp. HMSC068G04]|nr:hypothetical protein HMPREF2993_10875 [Corynebacterium sp. HMSC068G04]
MIERASLVSLLIQKRWNPISRMRRQNPLSKNCGFITLVNYFKLLWRAIVKQSNFCTSIEKSTSASLFIIKS